MLDQIILTAGNIIWGPHMLLLLVGTGLYMTVRLYGIQVTKFYRALTYVRSKKQSSKDKGDISPFQALATSLGAAVGNGNIVGVATAIYVGGPGAVFWMWIAAFVGMASKFSEVALSIHTRKEQSDGSMLGGPMMYLQNAFKSKKLGRFLAGSFAFAMGMKALFATSMIQSNSIATMMGTKFEIPHLYTGIVLTVITWMVIIGGIKSIAKVTKYVTPAMSAIYIFGGVAVIFLYIDNMPAVLYSIFTEAFTGTAVGGGFAGSTMMMAMRFGVARGAYSNEAGLGSAGVAHAAARTDSPVRQGLVAMTEVFVDTILLCSISAFAVLLTGEWLNGTGSADMTSNAFETALPGIGSWIVLLSSLLFGYSTLISYPYLGEQSFVYLFGPKIKKYFRWSFCFTILLGSALKVQTVWSLADTLTGMMAVPNLIGLLALSGVTIKLVKEFKNHNISKGA